MVLLLLQNLLITIVDIAKGLYKLLANYLIEIKI